LIIAARLDDSALLRDWKTSRVPVYFDFGESLPTDPLRSDSPVLWRLQPVGTGVSAYLHPVAKSYFIGIHLQGENFEDPFTQELTLFLDRYRKRQAQSQLPTFPPPGFRMQRTRRRL
jgi:hypothetical protein